jgi:cobalamin-dependent methionine synthase I
MKKGRRIVMKDGYRSARGPIRILTEKVGFPAEDIIFDPNIFPVATGMDEHRQNAIDFFRATKWIKKICHMRM